jgi:two-component system, OmpR family, alkaline phosphatase synthesis response regulator PhoP
MSKVYKVLAIDDENDIIDLLQYNLTKDGYEVKVANNGKKGIEIAKDFVPDVVLLDIMMPGIDGVETCRQLRENPKLINTFIIFLTARAEEYSEIAAFDNGADDYIIKPIKPRALMSRISALLRRESKEPQNANGDKVIIGDLVIDRTSYTVTKSGNLVTLPKKEFELLYYLATNPNKVYNRDELLASIWGTDVYVLSRTVDVHIRKVREKVGEELIQTIKGVGYKFNN